MSKLLARIFLEACWCACVQSRACLYKYCFNFQFFCLTCICIYFLDGLSMPFVLLLLYSTYKKKQKLGSSLEVWTIYMGQPDYHGIHLYYIYHHDITIIAHDDLKSELTFDQQSLQSSFQLIFWQYTGFLVNCILYIFDFLK